jgi:hypothetical protein
MSLSLRAEKKSIQQLFDSGETIYVIPEFQRPYSWSKDTCYQLFLDITSSFESGEEYFMGNIILAKNLKDDSYLNIIDGQQRMITLWLFLKVLSVLHTTFHKNRLLKAESILSDESQLRITSNVLEHADGVNIHEIYRFTEDNFENYANCHSGKSESSTERILDNATFLYLWTKEYYKNLNDVSKTENFLKYFLKNVYLLPVELDGDNMEEANYRALSIFETLNNRGQVLEDSDIFKAKLYKRAKSEGKEQSFISKWMDLYDVCLNMNMAVDDLFRYYYHILRAKEGQTNNETSLREYLIKDTHSALNIKSYDEIFEDLQTILDILQNFHTRANLSPVIHHWYRVLELYSNQYPKYTLVNYCFVNGMDDLRSIEKLLRMLVQYYYYRGATLQVKYDTYRFNKLISSKIELPTCPCSDYQIDKLDGIGSLKKGFALLAFYLEHPDYEGEIDFDILVRASFNYLADDWTGELINNVKNCIANTAVIDTFLPNHIRDKAVRYKQSKFSENQNLFGEDGKLSYSAFEKRNSKLKQVILDFFNERISWKN